MIITETEPTDNTTHPQTLDLESHAESTTPSHPFIFFQTPGPDSPLEDLHNNEVFRVSVYILAGWSISTFIFCAIITAVPWYNVTLNLGAMIPFATWFSWSTLLETGHIFIIILRLISGAFKNGYQYFRRKMGFWIPAKVVTQEQQGDAPLLKYRSD